MTYRLDSRPPCRFSNDTFDLRLQVLVPRTLKRGVFFAPAEPGSAAGTLTVSVCPSAVELGQKKWQRPTQAEISKIQEPSVIKTALCTSLAPTDGHTFFDEKLCQAVMAGPQFRIFLAYDARTRWNFSTARLCCQSLGGELDRHHATSMAIN